MAIAIEPEKVFPKVSSPAARNDRDAAAGEAGKGFARALLQATEAPAEVPPPIEASSTAPLSAFFDTPAPEVPDADALAEAVAIPDVRISAKPDEAKADLPEPAAEDVQEPETIIAAAAPQQVLPAPDVQEADLTEMAPAAMETPEATDPRDAPPLIPVAETAPEANTARVAAPAPQEDGRRDTRSTPKGSAEAAEAPRGTEVAQAAVPAEAQILAAGAVVPVEKKVEAKAADAAGPSIEAGRAPAANAEPAVPATGKPAPERSGEPFRLAGNTVREPKDGDAGPDITARPADAIAKPPAPDTPLINSGQTLTTPGPNPIQSGSNPTQTLMTPTHAVLTAGPAETVKIITESIDAPDDARDRITVQLDPPELGRVSIDFKFDAQGLQHVTVTGETPEALRQLRLMHFELVQALERNGLSSENMSFQQQSFQQQQQARQDTGQRLLASAPEPGAPLAPAPILASPDLRPTRAAGGGLDIKL